MTPEISPDRWLLLVLASFAVYRLALIAANEEGPFSLADLWRKRVLAWCASCPDPTRWAWVARGVGCPYCVSFWFAGLAALVLVAQGQASLGALPWLWPGLAGGACLCLVIGEERTVTVKHDTGSTKQA